MKQRLTMPAYDKQNSRAKQAGRYRTRSEQPRKRQRIGGGGLPDVVNPRTKRFEFGRVLKPDRKS